MDSYIISELFSVVNLCCETGAESVLSFNSLIISYFIVNVNYPKLETSYIQNVTPSVATYKNLTRFLGCFMHVLFLVGFEKGA